MAAGAVMLAYCTWSTLDLWHYQQAASHAVAMGPVTSSTPTETRYGELFGQLEIPELNLSAAVAEGAGEDVLRHAAGHIPGTAIPGGPGNTGIAGHRDTLFRPLRNVRRNDTILLRTLRGEFQYRVTSTRIVNPDDVEVLSPSRQATLTLVTCYPFYYLGPAPKRFIVSADLVGNGKQIAGR